MNRSRQSSAGKGEGTERALIESALLEIVSESGLLDATVASLAERAGVDVQVFNESFKDVEDAYYEVAKGFTDEFLARVVDAFNVERTWRNQIRAAAYAILRFYQEDERRARFLLLEMLSADTRIQLLRDQALDVIIDLIDEGRRELDNPDSMTRATAEGVAGAVYTQVFASTKNARFADADPLVPQLMYTVVLPYVGSDVAMEELHIPPPAKPARPNSSPRLSIYPERVSEEPSEPDARRLEELGPLPAGRHGLSREQVAHNQRERLVAGFAHAVAERGYHDTTIAHITKAASVSRRVFYENFEGKEQCFLAAFDIVIGHLHELMDEAGETASDWPHRMVAELASLLRFYAAEPELARLTLVEALAAGPVVAQRYRDALLSFAPRLEPGRALRAAARPLPESREGSLLGGLASLLSRQVASGQIERLPDLLPDLTEFLLTPYLGPDEAERLAGEMA